MKKINIGKLIQEACKNKQLAEARIEIFFSMPYSEIEKMYQQEHISSELLLKWSKLLKYDFFRIYSSHLINYHGISAKIKSENAIIESGLQIRKNLYTPEIKEFIIQKVQSGKMSTTEAIERYGVGRTTLFRWLAKEKTNNVNS
jgi:transposase